MSCVPPQIGNTELSPQDIIKIQKSYGCAACGGPQWGAAGDIAAAAAESEAACLWWLTTEPGKQIIIDIAVSEHVDRWRIFHLCRDGEYFIFAGDRVFWLV